LLPSLNDVFECVAGIDGECAASVIDVNQCTVRGFVLDRLVDSASRVPG
jgi:hypothetical protein